MWLEYPRPIRYAIMTRSRSDRGPCGSSHQRTVSHAMIATPASHTVYTFSFTTDWPHTVKAVAPMITASEPPTMRCQRYGSQLTSTRSVIRNHMAAETALEIAARMFTRIARFGAIGRSVNTFPMSTKNGLPGGCGMPRTWAAAMYSLVSHIAVEGPSVRM